MKWLLLSVLLVSCSFFKPAAHNKMIFEMKDYEYDLSLMQLKEKVLGTLIKDFQMSHSVSISFNIGTPAHEIFTKDQRICTNWSDEFNYNQKKFYAQSSMIDPAKLLSAGYLRALVKRRGREDVILLKNEPEEFILVQNHLIIRGVKVTKLKSKLYIEGITKMVESEVIAGRKCTLCEMNELKPFKKGGASVTETTICNIDLEKSLKFKRRLLSEELKFLYYIDPVAAKRLEVIKTPI